MTQFAQDQEAIRAALKEQDEVEAVYEVEIHLAVSLVYDDPAQLPTTQEVLLSLLEARAADVLLEWVRESNPLIIKATLEEIR